MDMKLIKTDDIYLAEFLLRNEMEFKLLHRIPAADRASFCASLLKKDGLSVFLRKYDESEVSPDTTTGHMVAVKGISRKHFRNQMETALNESFTAEQIYNENHSYPSPAGIIFDLDGTLIDSEPNYYESDRLLMEEYGVDFSEDMKKKYVGVGNSFMMEDLRRTYKLSDSMEVLLEKKNRYYMDIARRNTRAFPEMIKLVEQLAERGYRMAIASGSSPEVIEELTQIVGLRKHFEQIVSSEEVAHGKPAPDIFIEAARRLGIRAAEAIVLEDTQYGVEAAIRAGMRCVAVPTIIEPLDNNFIMADLLFADGMNAFKANAFFDWLDKF